MTWCPLVLEFLEVVFQGPVELIEKRKTSLSWKLLKFFWEFFDQLNKPKPPVVFDS